MKAHLLKKGRQLGNVLVEKQLHPSPLKINSKR